MAYEIYWTMRCVEWRYSGSLTGREIIESNNRIYGDERFDDLRHQLVDLSDVDDFNVSDIDMKHMAHLDKAAARSNSKIKLALVAPTGPASEVAEAYGNYSRDSIWETVIFETRDEAIAWLGR